MKGPAESGQICSVGRRKIAKKIAKNKRCYANTLRPRSRMLLKVMKGVRGGHYPLGHLRRGVIIPWVNLSVTGNGGTPPKVIPEGGAPPPHPHPPIMTELIRLMVRSCVMTRTMTTSAIVLIIRGEHVIRHGVGAQQIRRYLQGSY